VVQRVGDDGVILAEQRLEHTAVGIEAGRVQDGGVGMEEVGYLVLKLPVNVLRAADEADAAHAVTVRIESLAGRLDHLGVR